MKLEDFLKIINICEESDINSTILNNIGINISDSYITESIDYLISFIIKNEYGQDGYDWFNWWCYELPSLKEKYPNDIHAKECDGTPIILDTPEQLYNFLEKLKNEQH